MQQRYTGLHGSYLIDMRHVRQTCRDMSVIVCVCVPAGRGRLSVRRSVGIRPGS